MKGRGTILTPTLTVVQCYVRMMQSASAKTAPAIDDPNRCVDPVTRAKVESTAALSTKANVAAFAERTKKEDAIAAAFFFSSRRRHTRWNCDWSSDVCSSD